MMNEKLKEILTNIFAYFITGYIVFSWLLAFLLIPYEFIVGPMFNALSPEINLSYNLLVQQTNVNESQIITQVNQLLPIPINQFIIVELVLIAPTVILLGLIYYSSKKEDNNG